MDDRKWASERLAERGWGKPKQDVVIDDDRETSGFRIVYRQWPEGYDPLSKGEKPYQLPTDRSVHGKLALPPLEGPTAPKQRQWLAPRACGAPVSDRPTYCGRWVLSSRSRSTPRSLSRLVGAVRWSAVG